MAENFDALFEQYAEQQEAEAKLSNRGSFTQRNYETIEWTGLEINKPKVIRVMGGPPDSNLDPYTAKTVTISWLIGDDGKKFRVIRPSFNEDPTYILNRIISKVNTFKYVNNVKTFPVKDAHPEIFNIVEKNGLEATDPRAKYERGWKGSEVLIMNVIDRGKMDWHRENKHTMLLAKSVTPGQNGGDFVSEGISAYAVSQRLNLLFKSYGSWEKYDIAITRTGKMDTPYYLVNATRVPEEVEASVRGLISSEPSLTEEEKSWERYDLSKLFRITTATKIYNKIKGTIKKIDAALGTDFLSELQSKVEEEKKLFEELYGDENNAAPVVSAAATTGQKPVETLVEESNTPTAAPTVAPRVRTAVAAAKEPWQELPYGETLSEDLKKKVSSVSKDSSGKVADVTWLVDVADLAACPTCGVAAPLEATKCPVCGMDF